MTAVVAVLDGAKREIQMARAGHVAPFLVRAAEVPVVERLESSGPALGLVPSAAIEEGVVARRLSLKAGDVFFLHTDGLEELKDRGGDPFGADRVAAVLKSSSDQAAHRLLRAVIVDADKYAAGTERTEDVTAICLKSH